MPTNKEDFSLFQTLFAKKDDINSYDGDDIRTTSFSGTSLVAGKLSHPSTSTISISKFPSSNQSSANWIVYRLAEIYLMKAEALNILDFEANKVEVVTILNKIAMRAHPSLPASDSIYVADNILTQVDLANTILEEKQREFLFEGKRWFDLLRTSRREEDPNRVFNDYVGRNIEYDYRESALSKLTNEWARYLPIPKADLETNKLLVQNPFYYTTLDGK